MDHPIEPTPYRIDPAGIDLPGEAARLRGIAPLVRVMLPGGIPAWAPTRHATLRAVLLHPEVSKDPRLHWRDWPQVATRPEWAWIAGWVGVVNMLSAHGENHARLRRLVAPAFTARRTAAMRPIVERITGELLADLAALPAGAPVDLRAAYAHPLPMRVICELLGLPEQLRGILAQLIEDLVDTTATPQQAAAVQTGLHAVLTELITVKRARPADDLVTELITARDAGDRLDDDELRDTLLLVIGAGHETTVNLIGNAACALLTHPGQLAAVQTGEITWEAVIEETLRWAPPIANLPLRFTTCDLTFDGIEIPTGDAILATILSAGHDPSWHGETADTFDATRPRRGHLAFGAGAHHCLGAPLARLEASIALPALFTRFPRLHLAPDAEPPVHVPSFITHGYSRIPVHLVTDAR